jgi:hypothetical protein
MPIGGFLLLSTREIASLLLVGAFVVAMFAVPKFRRHLAPSFRGVLKATFVPRLVGVYVIVLITAGASTALAWWIGLWDWSLLKDAIILTGVVVLPMTFRCLSFKSGGDLAHRLVRDTLGLTAVLTFYLDAIPLPLVAELIVQALASFLVILQAFARTQTEWLPARRLCDFLLGALGIFLVTWTTIRSISTPPDWSTFFQSLFFTFWLPLSLLPFFYVFAFYAITGKVLSRFQSIRKPLTLRRQFAFMIGTRVRLSLLAQFNGRYNNVADGRGFFQGLKQMRAFRDDLKRRHREEWGRLASLALNNGRDGVDETGLHIDRREFDITKSRLNWIWTCQNGQYERQGHRYWAHLTDLIVDADKHGLPSQHGFVVETAERGQVWRAWRQTPGGAVLGVGGAERRSQYYFQGDSPPTGWPGGTSEWGDAGRGQWPPDWNKDDGTRL